MTEPKVVAGWSSLRDGTPQRAEVEGVVLVVVRLGDEVHVLHARCPHRAADLSEGTVEGNLLVCPEHGWDFRCDTGECEALGERAYRFRSWVDTAADAVLVDAVEVRAFRETDDSFRYQL